MSRSTLASCPIVISGRKDCTVDYSYSLSHYARESDHEELNDELNGAVAPQAPAMSSPTVCAAVYVIPEV